MFSTKKENQGEDFCLEGQETFPWGKALWAETWGQVKRKWGGKEVDLHRFWGKKELRHSGARRKLTRISVRQQIKYEARKGSRARWSSPCRSWWGFFLRVTGRYWSFPSFRMNTGRLGFPGGSVVKNLPANAGDAKDASSIPGPGRCPGVGKRFLLQHSCLENSMDREAWWAIVHGVTNSQMGLSTQPAGTGRLWNIVRIVSVLRTIKSLWGQRQITQGLKWALSSICFSVHDGDDDSETWGMLCALSASHTSHNPGKAIIPFTLVFNYFWLQGILVAMRRLPLFATSGLYSLVPVLRLLTVVSPVAESGL